MNEGTFWTLYTESVRFLKKLDLLKEENVHKRVPYSQGCAEYSRGKDYKSLYQNLVDNRDYDILLKDDSMLQMSFNSGESRLMFIQNPLMHISFESFLEEMGLEATQETMGQFHEAFDEDYHQALEGMNLNSGAVYLRYDVDARGRNNNENIHAYTHLHVGLNNSIRIPVSLHLTPLAFTMFVVRHVYYDVWVDAVRTGFIKGGHKAQCQALPPEMWTNEEKLFLYLA